MIEGWLTLVLADHWPKIAAASVTIWVTGWWIASTRRQVIHTFFEIINELLLDYLGQDNLKFTNKINDFQFKLAFHDNSNFIPRINANKRKIARKQRAFAEKKRLIHDHLTREQNQPLITEKRKDILCHSFEKLLQKLRDGTLDPVEVLEAYQVFF